MAYGRVTAVQNQHGVTGNEIWQNVWWSPFRAMNASWLGVPSKNKVFSSLISPFGSLARLKISINLLTQCTSISGKHLEFAWCPGIKNETWIVAWWE